MRLDELACASPPVATPPGAGARRASAVPVRVALLDGMRLCVDLFSLPENICRPEASVGPDGLELLELPPPLLVEPEPPPDPLEVDEPPPPEEPDDEDPVVVVRGTA